MDRLNEEKKNKRGGGKRSKVYVICKRNLDLAIEHSIKCFYTKGNIPLYCSSQDKEKPGLGEEGDAICLFGYVRLSFLCVRELWGKSPREKRRGNIYKGKKKIEKWKG